MLVKVVEKTGVFINIAVYIDRGVLYTLLLTSTKTGFCVKYLGKFMNEFHPVN